MPGIVPSLVLQASGRFAGTAEALMQAYEMVGAALGLFIAYLAYRGYRRNDSRPMFFIALGFVLVVGLPIPLVAVFLLVPSLPELPTQALIQTFEVAGLLCIIYALRADPA